MDAEGITTTVRVTWLILCGMMLFSRFLFQGAGAVWMRRFLDAWKCSRTHRAWGLVALAYGLLLTALSLRVWGGLGGIERAAVLLLAVILCADGLLNLVPSWFGHFKERMQDAWVRHHGTQGRGSDRQLFATVNALLGVVSVAVGAAVFLYRPMGLGWLLLSAGVAVALTLLLVGSCRREMRQPAGSDSP